jgi:predicted GTPase
MDLAALIDLNNPVVRARYEFAETAPPGLAGIVADFLSRR